MHKNRHQGCGRKALNKLKIAEKNIGRPFYYYKNSPGLLTTPNRSQVDRPDIFYS